MATLEEKLQKARERLAELESREKARLQRERKGERERKRKAEMRSAIVLMALLRAEAERDQVLAATIERVARRAVRPGDIEALRLTGWLPDAGESAPSAAADQVNAQHLTLSPGNDWTAHQHELLNFLTGALNSEYVAKAAQMFKQAIPRLGWDHAEQVAQVALSQCADAKEAALTLLKNEIELTKPEPSAPEPEKPTGLRAIAAKIVG